MTHWQEAREALVRRIRRAERRLRLQVAVRSSHRRARPLALLAAIGPHAAARRRRGRPARPPKAINTGT